MSALPVNPYLFRNLVHMKPLSARIARGTLSAVITIKKIGPADSWIGIAGNVASKGVLIGGTLLTLSFTGIETIALNSLALIALTFNLLLFAHKNPFLQKLSLNCTSVVLNSLLSSALLMFLIYNVVKNKIPAANALLKFHTANAFADHFLHFASCSLVQLVGGAFFDRISGRDPNVYGCQRVMNLVQEIGISPIRDVANQIQRELGVGFRGLFSESLRVEEYFRRHEEDREFLMNFDLLRIREPNYWSRAIQIVRSLLTDLNIIRPVEMRDQPGRFELVSYTPQESAYQESLAGCLKTALLEIYRDQHLSSYLNQDEESGQERLKVLDAGIYMPLLCYTQFLELQGEINCPIQFSNNLARYSPRRNRLLEAQKKLRELNAEGTFSLKQKILGGANYKASEKVEKIYLAISTLSQDLNQGPLMTKAYFSLVDESGDLLKTENLFQKACQEALAEIGE
jgi:hypothetical protein